MMQLRPTHGLSRSPILAAFQSIPLNPVRSESKPAEPGAMGEEAGRN